MHVFSFLNYYKYMYIAIKIVQKNVHWEVKVALPGNAQILWPYSQM
jgi:hypothetical protein